MDEARTEHRADKVNAKFAGYAVDFGFHVKPCIAERPRTKGKVEAQMKILDEIHAIKDSSAYLSSKRTFKSCAIVSINPSIKERVRASSGPSKGKEHRLVNKINASNMISYQPRQYSVPTGYQGRTVGIQVYDNHLYAY